MSFEWDRNKANANLKKHDIDFADAVTVLDDSKAITSDDPDHGEERFITIGMDAYRRILVVIYTWREDVIRIISARKAKNKNANNTRNELWEMNMISKRGNAGR